MAKARARSAARKVKDKWKAKNWYQIQAPSLFDNVPISETLSDKPDSLIGRVTQISMQDLTNDFRKSHIKLFFKINKVEESTASTYFKGHTLTSDYLRRMIRRRKSRVDGVYNVETKDGAYLRVKPFAITEKRIQNSQKKLIRSVMKETIVNNSKAKTLNELLKEILEGRTGSEIYKNCKKFYPVKRVEIHKTEISRLPTIIIEDEKPKKKEETKETEVPEKKTVKKPKTKKETDTEGKEPETKKEEIKEKPEIKEDVKKEKEVKEKDEKKTKKPATKKKTTAKKKTKTTKKKTAAKKTKKETK
ncbi:30S ribosomal protein S3ae [candidate division WOR-3 bacterium]|nr:30S ribosomal protein S3ae [candidate division WOR-3 bacterium]